ncbi:TetR/AcrR family transcriptional regulator [Rhodococcus sp. NPDC019627]|uniref:TetR/AcrR family transcriptional regulator n=1 Tax=unclassified Rhodococcus (in: high G+C Gram-positive bacteria) TaxID=192944 RepID=UPI0033C1AFF8
MSRRPKVETGLTRASITQAAIEIAQREGLSALTMRRLAVQMGVDSAAFYYHFKDKGELLRAVGRMSFAMLDIPQESDYPEWREWFIAVGNRYRDLLVQNAYLRTLLQENYVAWTSLPLYAVHRKQLLSERIPEDKHHFILESTNAFVIGSAAVTAHYYDAGSVITPGDDEDVAAMIQQRRDEFNLAFRVLLNGLITELRTGSARR